MINTDPKKIKEVLERGVVDVIEKENLEKRMLAGEKLRIKFGIDPTSPNIHIGHGSTIKKLREFQDLGHKIILIIGDGTARIGDTSDKVTGREALTLEQIDNNKEKYLEQISRVLDLDEVEIHHNSEWIDKINPVMWIELASLFTLQQMVERDNFALRMEQGNPVGLHEALYPLLQGYDSVAIQSDVEIGGTDQLFNLLAGRRLQKHFKQREQDILTLSLLAGTDGRKMSKSWGNVILITDEPHEKYGKVMRVADQLIPVYMECATDIPMERVNEVKEIIESTDENPMAFKKELAYAIVKLYDGEEAAKNAQEHFEKTVQGDEIPQNIPVAETDKSNLEMSEFLAILVKANLIKSKSEGRRLVEEGAVSVQDRTIFAGAEDVNLFKGENTIRVGRRRFLKLISNQ
jgi:tyrosyl-tRNA synthetase